MPLTDRGSRRRASKVAVGLGTMALGFGTLTAVLVPGAPAAQPAPAAGSPEAASPAPDAAQPGATPAAASAGSTNADLIARGKYLTDIGDCVSCHTAGDGTPFAGGRYMGMPFGQISTPNITPDKDTGIGNYTDDQFVRLFHEGITEDGEHIYPAMPYPWYATVKRDDILAIKAYLFSLAPVHAPRQPNKIYFPFTIRPVIAVWNWLFVPAGEFKPDPKQSDEVNRGAYLVNGLAHCGECHNNRNLLGNTGWELPFRGGVITKWATPNITNDKQSGLGRYSDAEVVDFLEHGTNPKMGSAVGPMAETVDHSLRKLHDDDIRAMVAYLKTMSMSSLYRTSATAEENASARRGSNVYAGMCSSCHQVDGKGVENKIPPLAGNGMVIAGGPQSVLQVVLRGVEAHGNYGPMPGLGAGMSDAQIADVANYVRTAWGNGAAASATPYLVSLIREDAHTLMNGDRPGGCPKLAQPDLQKILAEPDNGIVDTLKGMRLETMLPDVDKIIAKIKSDAPQISQEDIVNGLTVIYCPIVAQNAQIGPDQKVWDLTHFSDRVYTQLTTNGKY